MKENNTSYKVFFRIIEKYGPNAFADLDPNDPLVIKAEQIMENNEQFIYFGDLLLFKILYTSKRCMDMMGVEPSALSGTSLFNAVHPDDMNRFVLGRTKLLTLGHELFLAEKGYKILSSDIRMKNAEGAYDNLLKQFYIYYSTVPYKSVFVFKVHTKMNWFKKHRQGFHYYLGDDLSNFRYPDQQLLMKGILFSVREFNILQLIEKGCTSEQIAQKLYISTNTVNTHRRNILQKAQKEHITELIHELKSMGIL